VVVNPTSGTGQGSRAGAVVLERLRRVGLDVRDASASTAAAARHQAASAVASGVDALIVVGGDGMAHLGANACTGTGVPLGIIAAGTGNDVARGLGLVLNDPAKAAAQAVSCLRRQQVRAVDAARVRTADGTHRFYLGVLSAGFDALVNERANSWRWPRGKLRYHLATARELPAFKPLRYRLELDGVPEELEGMLVSVANGTSFGGGMKIAPDALLDDGLLDVVVLGPVSTPEFVRVFPTVFTGKHVQHRSVTVRRARRVSISTLDRDIVVYADGERVGPTPVECEVAPGAVRVLA